MNHVKMLYLRRSSHTVRHAWAWLVRCDNNYIGTHTACDERGRRPKAEGVAGVRVASGILPVQKCYRREIRANSSLRRGAKKDCRSVPLFLDQLGHARHGIPGSQDPAEEGPAAPTWWSVSPRRWGWGHPRCLHGDNQVCGGQTLSRRVRISYA